MGSYGRGLEHPHRLIHHEKSLMPSSPSPGAPADAPLSLGIDIGGTFTDIVVIDPSSGNAVIWKESTTPDDPARGTMLGLWKLVERSGIALERIGRVIHATTLFTNALIERKGAPTGLITTAGFADVLEIGRERKYELYDIFLEMPPPLVPRPWRREVPERLAPDGTVEIPLDVTALLREAQELVADGVRSLAICFLHAYANPAHERTAAAAIAQHFPDLSLSLSSDIAPEMREYPRMVTTVANAYVRPLAETYLDHLEAALHGAGIPGSLFLMLSNGGLTHVAEAKRAPVQLLESSPAAGALAGAWFSRHAGLDRVLAFDMGGTTAKLALVEDGEPLVTWGFEAARQKRFLHGSGLPIQIATVELIEIGAGGGSIARRSTLGTLHVGPESAAAQPGPVCYGRGGTQPTVTDADLALGYLNAEFFLGGMMCIDAKAATTALGRVSDELGLDEMRGAFGVHDIVNENMAGAARVAISERGRVPQEYTLLATGGAAPVHAWHVGRKLGVRHVVCPPGQAPAARSGPGPDRPRRVLRSPIGFRGLGCRDGDLGWAGTGRAGHCCGDGSRNRVPRSPPACRHALCRPRFRGHGGAARHTVSGRGAHRLRGKLPWPVRPYASGRDGSICGITPVADCAHAGSEQHAAPSGCCGGWRTCPEGLARCIFSRRLRNRRDRGL
jgi:N-methylhydantoinase A